MGDKKNILIVDDDMHIGNMLEETLRLEGYDVSRAYSGTEALMVLNNLRPDLILLDLMLPGLTGEELLPLIKGIPVIIVSAKLDMTNKVKLLLDGAADYVTKPFDMEELLARIVVQLRQAELMKAGASESGAASGVGEQEAGEEYHSESEITASNITLDWELHTVRIEGEEVSLTRTECAILRILMTDAGRPIGRNTILDKISYDTPDCTERSLKQHISNIRKKLQAVNGVDYIEAIYGIGFKFIKL
jgi:DNA-binding response OmpR family regulator